MRSVLTAMMTSSLDSFKCRRSLKVGVRSLQLLFASCRREERSGRHFAAALFSLKVLLENLLRHEDGRTVTQRGHRGHRRLARQPRQDRARDRLSPRPRADAGFHRRSRRRRSCRHARCDEGARRRAQKDQSAGARRSRHRPFGDGRFLRHARSPSTRTSSSNTTATASATPSSNGASAPSTISASCPPGTGICHQVNLEYLARTVWTRKEKIAGKTVETRLSRHARRHRQPHHHGQRPRRSRLGRRRHRGRGGDARPAHLHAHSRSRRLSG